MNIPLAITGDRPTGPLHLGHYVGSLLNRVQLQHTHQLTVLIADFQALTDNMGNPQKVRANIVELMKDYLAVGLDPSKVRFVLQSAVPELFSLTCYLQNLVSVGQLERNPTVRSELTARGFERGIPAGFLCYPVSQAADIIGLGGGMVPVGDDQLPMMELCNDLVRKLNTMGANLPLANTLLSSTPRLIGVDGKGKMSKSAGNAIALGCSALELEQAIKMAYTDPQHLKVSDPGRVEGNVVFEYLSAFDPNTAEVEELKAHYQRGGLGDMALKRRLLGVMEATLSPIRERRVQVSDSEALDILAKGTYEARAGVQQVLEHVLSCIGVAQLPPPPLSGVVTVRDEYGGCFPEDNLSPPDVQPLDRGGCGN